MGIAGWFGPNGRTDPCDVVGLVYANNLWDLDWAKYPKIAKLLRLVDYHRLTIAFFFPVLHASDLIDLKRQNGWKK